MADQRAVNDVQDSVHEDTEMHGVGGETDRSDNEYGNEEDADYYEDDYPEPVMMRDMYFENNTEELGYLLAQSESRAPSPDPSGNADMGEPLTAEEERADAKYRISRLTYHLSLSNTANERLQDARTALIADKEKVVQAAKEAAKEAEEKIKDAEEKVNDLKLKLETYKAAAIRDAIAQEKKVAQLQMQMANMSVQNSGIAQPAAAAPAVVAVASNEVAMLSPPVAVPPTAIAIGAQGSSIGEVSSRAYNRVIRCKHCAVNGLPCDRTRDSCAECARNGAVCIRRRCDHFRHLAGSCNGGACERLHKDD